MPTSSENVAMAVAFLHGLATNRAEVLEKYCDKERFTYSVAPKSFSMAPVKYSDYISRPSVAKDLKFEIHRAIGGDDGAAVWCSGTAVLVTDNKPYANEYVWLFDIDKNTGKITKLIEYVDSAYTKQRFAPPPKAKV